MQLLPLRLLSWKQPFLLPTWYCPSSFCYRKSWSDEGWLVIHEVGFIKKATPRPRHTAPFPNGMWKKFKAVWKSVWQGKNYTRWGINYWRVNPFQPVHFIAINWSPECCLVHWDQGQNSIPGLLTLHPLFFRSVITSVSPAVQQTPQSQEPLA